MPMAAVFLSGCTTGMENTHTFIFFQASPIICFENVGWNARNFLPMCPKGWRAMEPIQVSSQIRVGLILKTG